MTGDEAVLAAEYRKWLRAYPRSWRAQRQEEVLGVLLDVAAAEGRTAPTVRERLDLLGNGLAVRAGLTVAPEPVRRAAASAALAGGAVLGASQLVSRFAWHEVGAEVGGPYLQALGLAVQVAGVLALSTALVGLPRLTRGLCLFVSFSAPAAAVVAMGVGTPQGLVLRLLVLPGLLAGLALSAGGRVAGWGPTSAMGLGALAVAVLPSAAVVGIGTDPWTAYLEALPLTFLAVVGVGVALLARRSDLAGGLAVTAGLLVGFSVAAQLVGGTATVVTSVVVQWGPFFAAVGFAAWVARRSRRPVPRKRR